MNQVCRFTFQDGVSVKDIEAQLALAITTAEYAFGQAKVRISAEYFIPEDRPQAVIDVSTEVGEHIAQVFTGLMTKQVGEYGFTVERVRGKAR